MMTVLYAIGGTIVASIILGIAAIAAILIRKVISAIFSW